MSDESLIREKIREAFIESGLEAEKADQLAFHLTDWLEDLRQLQTLYANIGDTNSDQLRIIITKFLAHVPDHVAAGKKLIGLGPVTDIFDIGAIDDE